MTTLVKHSMLNGQQYVTAALNSLLIAIGGGEPIQNGAGNLAWVQDPYSGQWYTINNNPIGTSVDIDTYHGTAGLEEVVEFTGYDPGTPLAVLSSYSTSQMGSFAVTTKDNQIAISLGGDGPDYGYGSFAIEDIIDGPNGNSQYAYMKVIPTAGTHVSMPPYGNSWVIVNPPGTPSTSADLSVYSAATTEIVLNIPALPSGATAMQLRFASHGAGRTNKVDVTAYANGQYTDATGLAALLEYDYALIASNTAGNSSESNVLNAWTTPTAPSGLHKTANSPGNIAFAWTAEDNILDYGLFRRLADTGDYVAIIEGITDLFVTDTTAVNGVGYDYILKSRDAGGYSMGSNVVTTVTYALPGVCPAVITDDLTKTYTETSGNTPDIGTSYTGTLLYDVYASIDGDTFTRFAYHVAALTAWHLYGLVSGDIRYYRIDAIGAAGTTQGTVSAAIVTPYVDYGLTATPGDGYVDLACHAVSEITAYIWKRRKVGGTIWGTVGISNTNSYRDRTVTNGVAYEYAFATALIVGANPNSAPSESVTPNFPPQEGPDAPTGLAVSINAAGAASLEWTP